MGLGSHGGGVGAAKFFCREGWRVLVTDLKPRRALLPSIRALKGYRVKYVLGRHRKADFSNADAVFKGPDVPSTSPYLSYARARGIPIIERAGFFLERCPAKVIGITGTKGKSTTATLLAKILRQKGRQVWLLGTPGTSILEALPKIKKRDLVVGEFSSFELEDLHQSKHSPDIAIITSIFPDHLNRHKSFAGYIRAKSAIFRYQTKTGALIVPQSSSWLNYFRRNEIPGKLIKVRAAAYRSLFPKNFYWTETDFRNMALAFKAAEILGDSRSRMRRIAARLKPLPGRRELVAKIRGITFINDTTATNPDAAMTAIDHYGRQGNIILIAGGADKNLDYRPLAKFLTKQPVKAIIFLPGRATEKIKLALGLGEINRLQATSMAEAVKTARQLASPGDIVLLSPAAASFGLFRHEFDRGEQFVRAIKRLGT